MTHFQNQSAYAELRAALLASTHQNIATAIKTAEEATHHFEAFGKRLDRLTKLATAIEFCLDVLSDAKFVRAPASQGRSDMGTSAGANLPASEVSCIAALINDLSDLVESEFKTRRLSRALAFLGALSGGILTGAAIVLLASSLMSVVAF